MKNSYYKVLDSKAEILRMRTGQIGKFVGWIGNMLKLRFNDDEILCCFPDELETATKEQWKKQRMLSQLKTIGQNPILFGQILGSVL